MRSSLLDYEPEVHRLLPPAVLPAQAVELELATELLERIDTGTAGVDDEAYIVELIDNAIAGSGSGRSRRLSRPMVGALAHVLGLAARRVLRRRRAARMGAVGRLFALELEGLSPEDQLFEVSRQFVRLTREAARRAVPLDDRAARSPLMVDRAAHRALIRQNLSERWIVKDLAALATRLKDADIVVLTQQRTRFPRALIEQLPRLSFISQTGRNTGHIDISVVSMFACCALGAAQTRA